MADFNFTSNTASNLDNLNALLSMNPNLYGEESTNDNEETTSQPEEGVTGDAPVGDIQQVFQEDVSFDPNVGLELETNQVATNLPGIEDEDWWKLTNEEEDETFHRLMEMSLEEFEEMMRGFPGEAADPTPATPYAISSKRARHDEEELAQTTAKSAPLASQPSFEPQQIRQIRQIREAKSRRGKVIEALQARAQGLEVDLAKSRAEVSDAYENGRMVTLLGLNGEWEAKEAKIKADAEIEHHRQVGAIRTFLEGKIAEGKSKEENLEREANFALAQQRSQLEEANRQLDEKDKKLAQFRAEAEAYKANVEVEARRYKQAAEEGMRAQKKDLEAAESARTLVEGHLSEKTRALALAKPYVEGLEQKVADLERLDGAQGRAENARADQQQQKLLEESQSYAKDLEKKLAKLEKERTYQEAAQRRQEEELARSGTEACKALEGRIKDLEAAAEEATRAKESFTQANKDLNEELRSISGDLDKVQMALQTKTDELEKARSTVEEQVNAQKLQERRETRSVFGPMEQVNVEPSGPAHVKMPSAVQTFTFVAAKGLPPPLIERRQIHAKKSRRQLQHGPQPEPESQTRSKHEQEQEPTPTFSQLGMFSHHFHSPVTTNRPKRSHIHAEEAIRNRFRIPLGQVHTIASKLDQVGDWQDGMAEKKAGLIISAELTGLSIHDLKVMQGLRRSIPGSSPNPQNIMSAAQLEIPRTLVDLLASNNRPAIRAFLDGASFPQSQDSGNAVGETESRGTQTKAYAVEVEGDIGNTAGQGEVAVVLPKPKQTCGGPRSGFASLGKMMIFLYLLYLILPLLLPLPWSSPAAWLFEDPDPNSGWLDYVPEPSPWSNLLHDISGWPLISKFLDIFFDLPDLESKWCGNIPIG